MSVQEKFISRYMSTRKVYLQINTWAFPYWPETKSRPILAQANMGLDMEMILQ